MVLTVLGLLALASPVSAAESLTEYDTAPFSLAAHPRMAVEVLDHTSQPGYRLAQALPANTVTLTVLHLRWPRSDNELYLGVSQQGQMAGGYPGSPQSCAMALIVGEGEPQAISLPAAASAAINRLCVWPSESRESAELVFLYTLTAPASAGQDTTVHGFRIDSLGAVQPVDTGNALTLYGWFEARDVNDDDSYELVTSRNLDGTWGGFFYHTVRSYDAASGSFIADPDNCRSYFQRELEWLDWVLATRERIKENPQPYFNTTEVGYIYVAEYDGVRYGFDSIIEVPASFGGVEDVQQYNRERRDAFHMVLTYHDELRDWLAGGAYPATWKLAR